MDEFYYYIQSPTLFEIIGVTSAYWGRKYWDIELQICKAPNTMRLYLICLLWRICGSKITIFSNAFIDSNLQIFNIFVQESMEDEHFHDIGYFINLLSSILYSLLRAY